MTSLCGMSTSPAPRAPFTKDKISRYNSDSPTNTYRTRYSAHLIPRGHLHRSHPRPRTHLLQWLHLPLHPLRLYLLHYFEWSPALTVSSICLSVLSMLSSAVKKVKPANDSEFVKRAAGRGPKAFLWSYDDDKAWLINGYTHGNNNCILELHRSVSSSHSPKSIFNLSRMALYLNASSPSR